MKECPSFTLMKQTDVQTIYHMQMPRWLFSDPRYASMSLDAKVAYTFLLNRFQLSCRNGWVNDCGEVFVIFPRKELAHELRICEQRVTAAFRTLKELNLIREKRCGRGDANQIYLATVESRTIRSTPAPPLCPRRRFQNRGICGQVIKILVILQSCVLPKDSIKVGLEATGHYSYNLLGFLLDSGLPTYVLNPLHTNLYRKSLSLRKTKTDKVDARTIAAMLLSNLGLKPYTDTAYHNEELVCFCKPFCFLLDFI